MHNKNTFSKEVLEQLNFVLWCFVITFTCSLLFLRLSENRIGGFMQIQAPFGFPVNPILQDLRNSSCRIVYL